MKPIENKKVQGINILIIDDHKMIRDGLKIMLGSLRKNMQFNIMEAETGEDALIKISRHCFELVIMDYQMPGISGAETIHRILRFKPEMKILALSNYDEFPYIQSMMEAGAKGYVLKNIEPAEMLNAIKTILAGQIYYCNEVAVKLIDSIKDTNSINSKVKNRLTRREIEVLQMIAMEMTNNEIAQKLFLAKRTVDTHRQNLKNKLNVKNTVGLAKAAYALNLMSDDSIK
jgi:DNA-binding NarL/FixJ family response regulator